MERRDEYRLDSDGRPPEIDQSQLRRNPDISLFPSMSGSVSRIRANLSRTLGPSLLATVGAYTVLGMSENVEFTPEGMLTALISTLGVSTVLSALLKEKNS